MSSVDSIIAELVAENKALRDRLQVKREPYTQVYLSRFVVKEELADKLKIRGIFIAEGVWKGVLYPWKELKKMLSRFKEKLKGLPIKVEHLLDKKFKDKTVGEITEIKPNEFLKAIEYEAVITDPLAIEKIKDGTFQATSPQFRLVKEVRDGVEVATDLEPIENSLTRLPACPVAKIFTKEALSLAVVDDNIKIDESIESRDEMEDSKVEEKVELKEETKEEEPKEEVKEELKEEEKEEEEYIELTEPVALCLPEDLEVEGLSEDEEEIELEIIPLAEADKVKKRKVVKIVFPGRYPRRIRTVRRKRGYYYYYPPLSESEEESMKYPVPYYAYRPYYKYPYYYPHYGYGYGYPWIYYYYEYPELEIEKGSEEDTGDEEKDLGQFKIIKNKKTGKYVVMKNTGKKGFGAWKIVKQFDTMAEAEAYIKEQYGELSEMEIVRKDLIVRRSEIKLNETEKEEEKETVEAKEETKTESKEPSSTETKEAEVKEEEKKVEAKETEEKKSTESVDKIIAELIKKEDIEGLVDATARLLVKDLTR